MSNIIIDNKNISKGELKHIIAEIVVEILDDPDFGLDLQDWVKKRLRKKLKKFVSSKNVS